MRTGEMAGWIVAASMAVSAAQQRTPAHARKPAAKSGQATLVVSCDVACNWRLDDDDAQALAAAGTARVRVDPGQHVVAATTEDGKDHVEKQADVEAGDQETVQFRLLATRIERLKKELADQQERIRKFQEGGEVTPQPATDASPKPATEDKPAPATDDKPQPSPGEKPLSTVQPAPGPAAAASQATETAAAAASLSTAAATPQPLRPPAPQRAAVPAPQPTIASATPSSAEAGTQPSVAPASQPSGETAAQPVEAARLELSPAVAEQLLTAKTTPAYPEPAREAGVSGIVVLHATITRDGSLKDLAVVSGPDLLQKAAWDAASKWKYSPYLVNGQAVEAGTTITMTFKLREPAPEPPPAPGK